MTNVGRMTGHCRILFNARWPAGAYRRRSEGRWVSRLRGRPRKTDPLVRPPCLHDSSNPRLTSSTLQNRLPPATTPEAGLAQTSEGLRFCGRCDSGHPLLSLGPDVEHSGDFERYCFASLGQREFGLDPTLCRMYHSCPRCLSRPRAEFVAAARILFDTPQSVKISCT